MNNECPHWDYEDEDPDCDCDDEGMLDEVEHEIRSDSEDREGFPCPGHHERDEDGYLIDGVGFAEPGGHSALRAATRDNPRNLPCPTCKRPNMLTPADRRRGYQCDICADAAERGYDF